MDCSRALCLVLGWIWLEFDCLTAVYEHGLMDDEAMVEEVEFHVVPVFAVVVVAEVAESSSMDGAA